MNQRTEPYWQDIILNDSIRKIFFDPEQAIEIRISRDENDLIVLETSPASWGDLALVFPAAGVIPFTLPLSGKLSQAEETEAAGDDPPGVKLYLELANGAPLVMTLLTEGLTARARFFAYAHRYEQDTAYVAADAEELVEKAAILGDEMLWPEEQEILPACRLLMLLDGQWLNDPAKQCRHYNQDLNRRQKQADRQEAGQENTETESISFADRWLCDLSRQELSALIDAAGVWLRSGGDDQPLAEALRQAVQVLYLPAEIWPDMHPANPDIPVPIRRETRIQRHWRVKTARLWQQHRTRAPGKPDLHGRLAMAFYRLSGQYAGRPAKPWLTELSQRVDILMHEKGYDGQYPEYSRQVGKYRKWALLHELYDTDGGTSEFTLTALLRYGDAARRRWVSSGGLLLLLSATIHPLLQVLPDDPQLSQRLDAITRIFEGLSITREDRLWLSDLLGDSSAAIKSAFALTIPSSLALTLLVTAGNTLFRLAAAPAGGPVRPLTLAFIIWIAAASSALAFAFWAGLFFLTRHIFLPRRQLGRKS
ncbi:MAG: hypothetical protein VB070_08090 [Clostridiaceae bacterium]|nr:hypothetical protein [Clostridiaceae bacterium]